MKIINIYVKLITILVFADENNLNIYVKLNTILAFALLPSADVAVVKTYTGI